MLTTHPRFQTFEDYLKYNDNSEKLYELFNGELIEMPPESGLNFQIANRIFFAFASILGTDQVRGNGLELEVRGEPKNRYPDLTIIRQEHIEQLSQRNTLRLSMSPPILVIEVVSPGEIQRERDYIAKRTQYQDCGIPEYWIVDPQTQTILILELTNQTYTEIGTFRNNDFLPSPNFPQFNLTVNQILNPTP
ncbi:MULTISPECIES: Uma2 family endonuclease [Roseofilum]|uniref:Uma2 family endonuclease n=2 Tax=Roseofilum TaxID=1233426 RepID=A0ABT7BCW1_9CYAN|nr:MULTISPECIES: Uma2 family endonuclease [Roseofilum]MDJ1171299.1 Uma2 family endonuclease [Roseofilum acuticapitatum BLCC-M154]MDJ1176915.1 Uma2 family endonuclease [Roseofilum capinflatum BLCC-M114]